jgi:hydrogenase 3 maturation protease
VKPENLVLRRLLSSASTKSLVIIGLGNSERGDDGCGLQIASQINAHSPNRAFLETEKSAEGLVLDFIEDESIETILFIDATDFGGKPGEFRLFTAEDAKRFASGISTHKFPITLLMGLIRQGGKTPYLLGIQPGNLDFLGKMSPAVKASTELIVDCWTEQT